MPPRLDSAAASAVMVAAGLEPQELYPGYQKPWRCKCLSCGAAVSPQYANIRAGQGGCVYCARRSSATAVEQMRAAGFEPQETYPGIREPWTCRCMTCGKTVTPRLHHIVYGGSGGCKWCGRRAVDAEAAAAVMREKGLVPLTPYPGSGVPWLCKCVRCGTEVSPQYGVVRLRGGCRFCARGGFDPAKPAVVYLVTHKVLGAVKVGVGSSSLRRISAHKKHGWTPVAVIPVPGEAAKKIEKAVLRWWREDLGLPSYLGPEDMLQDGWTETAELDAVDLPETVRRIEQMASQTV